MQKAYTIKETPSVIKKTLSLQEERRICLRCRFTNMRKSWSRVTPIIENLCRLSFISAFHNRVQKFWGIKPWNKTPQLLVLVLLIFLLHILNTIFIYSPQDASLQLMKHNVNTNLAPFEVLSSPPFFGPCQVVSCS